MHTPDFLALFQPTDLVVQPADDFFQRHAQAHQSVATDGDLFRRFVLLSHPRIYVIVAMGRGTK
jgi:hypothetical protein